MKYGLITIHFKHYWHCGSGQAGEGDVDLLPVIEPCGLPYVPARALRGRLKWAAREQGWNDEVRNYTGKDMTLELRLQYEGDADFQSEAKTTIFDIRTVETTLTVKAGGEPRTYPGSVKYHNGVNATQSRVKLIGG